MSGETFPYPPEAAAAEADDLPPEILFLRRYGASSELLSSAKEAARRTGVSADAALLANGRISEEQFYRCLADALRLRYFDGSWPLAAGLDATAAIRAALAPLAPNGLRLRAVVAPTGPAIGMLMAAQASGRPVRDIALCAPARLASFVRTHSAAQIAKRAADALADNDRTLSARGGAGLMQSLWAIAMLAAGAALGLRSPETLRLAISAGLLFLFTGAVWLRSLALAAGRPAGAVAPLLDRELPRYTVVVALRREAAVVASLICALDALDYPRAKLEIKIVVEADDVETREAVAALRPHSGCDLIVAPPGAPMTKPRALNVALMESRGELLTVFDAEDTPAPDQLRRAAARFAAEPGVDCLQARLVIDNASDSWLSASFALEYATLFDFVNPGLASLDLPIPLGGTSNHFRVRALRRVGGWDAWNVTEDADLGLRLARFGARVAVLDSETREEAPNRFKNWFRQRVRWQKGWIQTLVTHTRSPLRVLGELGPLRAVAALLSIAGVVVGGLLGPPLFLEALTREFLMRAQPGPLGRATDVATYVLVLWGAQNVIVPALIVLRRRPIAGAWRALAMTPAYYMLICLASWVALFEWFARPFHWGKTEHGLRKCDATISATSRAFSPPDPLSARLRPSARARPAAAARRSGRSA